MQITQIWGASVLFLTNERMPFYYKTANRLAGSVWAVGQIHHISRRGHNGQNRRGYEGVQGMRLLHFLLSQTRNSPG